METNFSELQAHLREVFEKLFTTKSFEREASQLDEVMRRNVLKALGNSKYDYEQSGRLLRAIETTGGGFDAKGSKFIVVFGSVNDLNRTTKRGPQRAVFFEGTNYRKVIRLKPEPFLPSWIIAEFGRKAGQGVNASNIPKDFIVPFGPRRDKPFMFGPSDSRHNRKAIFFMASQKGFKRAFPSEKVDNLDRHPGIKEGRIFRQGLENSIPEIQAKFSLAIENSIDELGGAWQ